MRESTVLSKKNLLEFDKNTNNRDNKRKQITDELNNNNYDSFIDSGAFLIDFTVEEVIDYFYKNLVNKSKFIYIDNDLSLIHI